MSAALSTRPLVEAGLSGTATAGEVLHAALERELRELRDLQAGVYADDIEAIGEMRVATRRLRSLLGGFPRLLPRRESSELRAGLKWLSGRLAVQHDRQVLLDRLTADLRSLPDTGLVGLVAAGLAETFGPLAFEHYRTLRETLDDDRYGTLIGRLESFVAAPPLTVRAHRSAAEELPRAVARAYRALNRRLDSALALPAGAPRDEALHEARKADKQLRYILEVVSPALGKPAKRLRREAKKLQDLLGEQHDAVETQAALGRLSAAPSTTRCTAFGYGVLYATERERAREVLDALPDRLTRIRSDRVLDWLPEGVTDG